jgi:ribokinase
VETRPRICVLGSINTDLVVRSPRLPAPGETILGGPFETHPGGKGANQAVAAARMGAEVAMIARVGEDDHGRTVCAALEAEGIDGSRVFVTAGSATGVALITVADSAENTIVVAPGANAALSPADVDTARETIARADVLLMQLETPMETVARAAEIAREAGTTVMLNAAPGRALPAGLLASIDVLVVNETEAALVAGPLGGGDCLDRLRVTGVGAMALTLGAAGARYLYAEATGHVEPFAVQPVDTVGAGDAFTGTLAARWGEHQVAGALDPLAVADAVCWANAAGALATTRRGAIPSLPTRREVVALLRSQCPT